MSRESAYFIANRVIGSFDLPSIQKGLKKFHGVQSVHVNPQNHLVCVDYDSSGISYDIIENCLNRMGYEIAADASNIQTR